MGSFSFLPGELKTLRIQSVTVEMVPNKKGEEEECVIVNWHEVDGELPLILNKTNAETIAQAVNSHYLEDWIDQCVILSVQNVKAFGDIVPAVRVSRKPANEDQRITFLRKRYQQVRKHLKPEEQKKIDADLAGKKNSNELTADYIELVLNTIFMNVQPWPGKSGRAF